MVKILSKKSGGEWGHKDSRYRRMLLELKDRRWYLYILLGDGPEVYIGISTDVPRRLQQHLEGVSKSTRNMKNIRLIGRFKMISLDAAIRAEYRINHSEISTLLKHPDMFKEIIEYYNTIHNEGH